MIEIEKPEVLYVDNHILVVNKPQGIPTQPSQHNEQSLEDVCKDWIKVEYNKPGNVYLHAVHRLDKGVSGAVLFARSKKALTRLNEAMRAKATKKIYWAIVEDALPHDEGTLRHYLLHEKFKSRAVKNPNKRGAKLAELNYTLRGFISGRSLLEIELLTGRYHQIRVQLAAEGFPIIGDTKYGSKLKMRFGIALHHREMTITHPTTKEQMVFTAPIQHHKVWQPFTSQG